MPDMTAIMQALTSLKAAKDIAEAMVGLRDAAAFQSKLVEFQSKLIDANNAAFAAQEERSTLLEKIHRLEKQIADFEVWEAEKQRYELVSLAPNAVAYAPKDAMRGSDPPHYLCGNCFGGNKKSFLQQYIRGSHIDRYRCNACGEELTVDKGGQRQRYADSSRGPGSWMGV
jgi:hypothetical protein